MLVVFHRFGDDCPERLSAKVGNAEIARVLCEGDHGIVVENGVLSVKMPEEFGAVAVYLN